MTANNYGNESNVSQQVGADKTSTSVLDQIDSVVQASMILPTTSRTIITSAMGVGVRTIIVGMEKEGDLKAFISAYLRSQSGVRLPEALTQSDVENVLIDVYAAQNREKRFSSMAMQEIEFADVVGAIRRVRSHMSTESAHYHAYMLLYFMKSAGLCIVARLPVIPLLKTGMLPSFGEFMNDVKASLICAAVASKLQEKLAIYKQELKTIGNRYVSSSAFHSLSMPARLYSSALQEAYKIIASELSVISCAKNALGCALQYVQDPTVQWSAVAEQDLQYLASNFTFLTYALRSPAVLPTSALSHQADASRFAALIKKYFSLREGGVSAEGWKEGEREFALRPLTDVLKWTTVRHIRPADSQASPISLISIDLPEPKKFYGAFVPTQADNLAYRVVEDTALEGKLAAVYRSCDALLPMDQLEELYAQRLTEGNASQASSIRVTPVFSGTMTPRNAIWVLANAVATHAECLLPLAGEGSKSSIRLYGRLAYPLPSTVRWLLPQKGDWVYVDVPPHVMDDRVEGELRKFIFACAAPHQGTGIPICGELPMLAFTGSSKTERHAVWLSFNEMLRPRPPRIASFKRQVGGVEVDFTSSIVDDDGAIGMGDQQIVASITTLARSQRLMADLDRILRIVNDTSDLEPIARNFVELAQRVHGRSVLAAATAAQVDRSWFLTQQGKAELLAAAVGKALAETQQYHGDAVAALFNHLIEHKAIQRAIIKMTRNVEV